VGPLVAQTVKSEAPFGDKVSERIPLYHRAAPGVATSGPLGRLGLIEAKAVGFRSVLNLGGLTSAAGVDDRLMAEYVVLRYFTVPLTDPLPSPEQVAEIRSILENPDHAPILMYGADRDQAAAAWALARAQSGVPAELAFQEGLTAGLRERLDAVRAELAAAGSGAP
jgi:hypothetical protein